MLLSFLFLTAGLTVHASESTSHKKLGRKLNIHEDKAQRLAQAKELLGSHYKHSVVRFGEQIPHVHNYLITQVEAALPKKYKKDAAMMTKCIFTESKKYGFDPLFVLALMTNESHLNPETVGRFGEIGLMQIKPDTAKWISNLYHFKWAGEKSLRLIKTNIKIGTAYLDYLRDKFDNHSRLYLSAYNMGPSNVRSALSRDIWPKDYVVRVMDYYVKFYADLTDHSAPVTTRHPAQKVDELTAMAIHSESFSSHSPSRKPQSVSRDQDPLLQYDPIAEDTLAVN